MTRQGVRTAPKATTLVDYGTNVRAGLDRISTVLDEQDGIIRVIDPAWSDALRDGVVVNVSIRRPRFETSLSLEDLGIRMSDDPEVAAEERQAWSLLLLGKKLLRPADVLREWSRLDGRGRATLDRGAGYALGTFWGPFVPAQRYSSWKAEIMEIQRAYYAAADAMVDNWNLHTDQVRREYSVLLALNWTRFTQAGVDLGDMDTWRAARLDDLMRQMPGRDEARSRFSFEWDLSYIPLASAFEDDQLAAVRSRVEEDARIATMTEMERDLWQRTNARKEELLDGFVRDVQAELKTRIYDVCSDVLGVLERHPDGKSPANSTRQLKDLVDAVHGLKFWDDPEMDAQMRRIEAMLNRRPEDRRAPQLAPVMREIGAAALLSLHTLDRVPERKGRTGFPDSMPDLQAIVRQQRDAPAVIDGALPAVERQQREVAVLA